MEDIAREAGLAKATLYLHFDGKDAIFRRMLDACRNEVEARAAAAEASNLPLTDRLVAVLDAHFGTALAWFEDTEHLRELAAFAARRDKEFEGEGGRPRARVEAMLASAQRSGELAVVPNSLEIAQIARVLINAARGAKHGRAPSPETYRKRLVEAVAVITAGIEMRRAG